MTSKKKWAARGAVLALSASVLTGVGIANAGNASALGSTCTPPGPFRPEGPLVTLLAPTLGWPGYAKTPLGDAWVPVVATVDSVVCQVLP